MISTRTVSRLRLALIAAALAALATASSAQAVTYLQLGASNASNATTTLTGTAPGAELKVVDANGTVATSGVLGLLTATSPTVVSAALKGQNSATNGIGYGVYGSHAGAGIGVNGSSSRGIGVRGQSTDGTGVLGQHTATAGTAPGVYGSSPNSIGVSGYSQNGDGVAGLSLFGDGVVGVSAMGLAGRFSGNVTVTGTLTKGGGAFRIDHPLDPAHTYLQHSFVESPDMMDVYNGNVRTNAKGFATVRLPKYFQALNRSFRYQLTSLSGLQEVAVAKEIAHNRFTIQSQKPHARISWQVTGIRHDRFANANRIKVVLPKPRAEQGKYLHPELYGQRKSEGIGYVKPPALPRRSSAEEQR